MYEICTKSDAKLKFGEFKSILKEIFNFTKNGQNSVYNRCSLTFTHYSQFFGLKECDIIPPKSNNIFDNIYYLNWNHIIFNFHVYPSALHRFQDRIKQECSAGSNCNVIKKMQNPNQFRQLIVTKKKGKNILNHLRSRSHSSALPIGYCKNGLNCASVRNFCSKGKENTNEEDQIHVHMFQHLPLRVQLSSNQDFTHGNINIDNMCNQPFKYIDASFYRMPTRMAAPYQMHEDRSKGYSEIMVLLIMQEVITNNFAADLVEEQKQKNQDPNNKKKYSTEFTKVLRKHNVLDIINSISCAIEKHNNRNQIKCDYTLIQRISMSDWDGIIDELKQTYTILNVLDKKCNIIVIKRLGHHC